MPSTSVTSSFRSEFRNNQEVAGEVSYAGSDALQARRPPSGEVW